MVRQYGLAVMEAFDLLHDDWNEHGEREALAARVGEGNISYGEPCTEFLHPEGES